MADPCSSRSPYWAVALLFVLLMLPNAGLLWLEWPRFPMTGRIALPLSALLTVFWFALFGRRVWLACLLLSPVALLMPLEFYYVMNYGAPTTVTVLGTLAATTMAETRQYMGSAIVPVIGACGASLSVALIAAWLSWRHRVRWQGRLRRAVVYLSCLAMAAVSVADFAKGGEDGSGFQGGLVPVADAAAGRIERQLTAGFPTGMPLLTAQFVRYQYATYSAVQKLASYRFGARLVTPLPTRQIYVLVIGESSRRDHWQLFGYSRHTNPELSKERNLVPIGHMVSAFTQTMTALPVMLTRKPTTWPRTEFWPEASIVRAMHEAGFQTWWISNQYAVGPYDSAVAVYANEAENVRWLNHSQLNGESGSVDQALIDSLRHVLERSTGNLFIVLHMLGSHENYDFRYPHQFAHFRPTETDEDSSVPAWMRAVNSYDNTILYTDFVLARVIEALRDSKAISAMWYASDHGETLPSPTCSERGHGRQNRPEFQIPSLFWYSDAYDGAFPGRVVALREHANQRTMSESIFPSFIDMAGVDFPGHSRREDWSLLSPQWRHHTRWVNQFWRVDFDAAMVGSGCMQVGPGTRAGQAGGPGGATGQD